MASPATQETTIAVKTSLDSRTARDRAKSTKTSLSFEIITCEENTKRKLSFKNGTP